MSKFNDFKDILKIQGVKAKGFGIIPKLVMQDDRLSIESKAIYSYFCSFAGAGETAFPSINKICFDLGISDERYRKHFKPLKEYGYIEVEQQKENGRFARNIYTLIDKPTLKTPSPEIAGTEKSYSENLTTKNNSIKNNNIENHQSVSQSNYEPTDKLSPLFNQAQIDLFESEEIKDTLRNTIAECYNDDSTREIIKKIKLEHIDIALRKYRLSQDEKEIKNPRLYFKKCLLSAIMESGLKGLF